MSRQLFGFASLLMMSAQRRSEDENVAATVRQTQSF